ncbi:hypothetical protein CB1_000571003 [Camelus ferus]|nr:hypothetical protein CB1_000571003 [Camelus ferus]
MIQGVPSSACGEYRLLVCSAPQVCLAKQQEQDPTNLYISNLPISMDEQELENMLKPFGHVISTRILRDANGVSRGVGFARMESTEKCEVVIQHFNGKYLKTPPGIPGLCIRSICGMLGLWMDASRYFSHWPSSCSWEPLVCTGSYAPAADTRLKFDDDRKDASQKTSQCQVNGFYGGDVMGKDVLKVKGATERSVRHLRVVFTVCKLIGCRVLGERFI